MTTAARPKTQSKRTEVSVQVYPSRVNAAGVCVMCFERCGDAAECVERFASLLWIVCPNCAGTGWDAAGDACGCWSGAMEASPAMLRAAEAKASGSRR